jgi:hypothetical protein
MNRFYRRARPNPTFKLVQPLPVLAGPAAGAKPLLSSGGAALLDSRTPQACFLPKCRMEPAEDRMEN